MVAKVKGAACLSFSFFVRQRRPFRVAHRMYKLCSDVAFARWTSFFLLCARGVFSGRPDKATPGGLPSFVPVLVTGPHGHLSTHATNNAC